MKKNSVKNKDKKPIHKISSTDRLEELLEETEQELLALGPQIDKLEKQIEKLKELKLAKQKLITLKLSIKSILSNFSLVSKDETATNLVGLELRNLLSSDVELKRFSTSQTSAERLRPAKASQVSQQRVTKHLPDGVFVPERAFQEADCILRRKDSINYELYRAIVFNGGSASTEALKQYLLDHAILQPGNGQSFEHVELTDISSRVNYLVRKGIVTPDGRGNFISNLGWLPDDAAMATTPTE